MSNAKNCTPENCPHRALLDKARTACLSCTCGGAPAGKGGMVSLEAAGERNIEREAKYIDRTPRGQVTNLPAEVEDRVAEQVRSWLSVDPVDYLLALHTCNGGKVKDFGAYLERTAQAIDKLRPERKSFRATAWAKWQRIVKRIPGISAVQSWSKGGGGAKAGHTVHYTDPAKEAARIEKQQRKVEKACADYARKVAADNQRILDRLQAEQSARAKAVCEACFREAAARAAGDTPSATAADDPGANTTGAQPCV